MPRPTTLTVYWGQEIVGTVFDSSPLSFEYASAWLTRLPPMPIAAIPLRTGRQDSAAIQAFFENLLPEGELRRYLMEREKASSLFSMLLAIVGDAAGAFVLLPEGEAPQAPTYEASTWKKLAAKLQKTNAAAINIKGKHARISLAGAQDKTSIALFDDGVPRLPQGTAPSTHILKPNIQRLAKVWHSAANETIVMLTAAHCGLPTAQVFYEPNTQACVVRRFDRVIRDDGLIDRLIQYDLCQLAGLSSEKKYEKEGGLSLSACAQLIRNYSAAPALDLRHFLQWVFFNLYVGNNDSHAKNLSMLQHPERGMLLSPFYDLMCTRLYPGLSQEFAFAIDGETRPGAITHAHVTAMAKQLRMQPPFVTKLALDLAARLPDALNQAVEEVAPHLPHGAHDLAKRLKQFVLTTTKKTAARLQSD
ncbi:MAG TPA: type II toxin-antitoxin system HipA family toxin [Burkholderiaceae bacterium]|nr:type II toxin-antitoxin system HipA family toxin [Burkholderiaceae bacterium]